MNYLSTKVRKSVLIVVSVTFVFYSTVFCFNQIVLIRIASGLDNVKTNFNPGIVFQVLYISFCCVCYILIYIVIDFTRLVTVLH